MKWAPPKSSWESRRGCSHPAAAFDPKPQAPWNLAAAQESLRESPNPAQASTPRPAPNLQPLHRRLRHVLRPNHRALPLPPEFARATAKENPPEQARKMPAPPNSPSASSRARDRTTTQQSAPAPQRAPQEPRPISIFSLGVAPAWHAVRQNAMPAIPQVPQKQSATQCAARDRARNSRSPILRRRPE